MNRPAELPAHLGDAFAVRDGLDAGVTERRLRGCDLSRPFHGVRLRRGGHVDPVDGSIRRETPLDRFESSRIRAVALARAYAVRMPPHEFFTHTTAAHLWGAPLPLGVGDATHVGTLHPHRAPRGRGVRGHAVRPALANVVLHSGLRVTDPATTWAMLGRLAVVDLVVLGDYFVRVWRDGYFRRDVGRPALTTFDELRRALKAGRREGADRLRASAELIREDSWSPNETRVRCALVWAGLPEPVLNLDVYDAHGEHLGCLDIVYPEYKVAVEYHGQHHAGQYARDIERLERLRAEGWRVIQVTWPLLFKAPDAMVARVRAALRSRGWRG